MKLQFIPLLKDFLDIFTNGVLTLILIIGVIFCVGLFFHTFWILAGFSDILYQDYGWNRNLSLFPVISAMLWLNSSIYVNSLPKDTPSVDLYWLFSILFIIGLHISLFTTKMGFLYLESMNN